MSELLAAVPGPYELVDGDTVAWREPARARLELLSLRDHASMLACATFAPRDEHAQAIAAALDLSPARASRVLEQLLERDLLRPYSRFVPQPRAPEPLPPFVLVLRAARRADFALLCDALAPRIAADTHIAVVLAEECREHALALARSTGATVRLVDAAGLAGLAHAVPAAARWLDPARPGGFRRLAQVLAGGACAWLVDDSGPPRLADGSDRIALPADIAPAGAGQSLAALLGQRASEPAALYRVAPEALPDRDGEQRVAAVYAGGTAEHPRLVPSGRSATLVGLDTRTLSPPSLGDGDDDAAWLVPALHAVDRNAAALESPLACAGAIAPADSQLAILGAQAGEIARTLLSRDAPARIAALALALADRAHAQDEWLAAQLRTQHDTALVARYAASPRQSPELPALRERLLASPRFAAGQLAALRTAFADAAALLSAWAELRHDAGARLRESGGPAQ